MSEPYAALSAPVEEDLLPLSALLHQRGVPHRVVEDGGKQVLLVGSEANAAEVRELYRAWRAGELSIRVAHRRSPGGGFARAGNAAWLRAPVTLSLIALSIAGFLLVHLAPLRGWVTYLTFMPFALRDGQLVFADMGVQYWRLVTPIFLHFGWLHIAFNCLFLWVFGSRVEPVMGRLNTLMLCLVIALVSNTSQYVYGGPGMFGGMSGVVYGLLGFAWLGPQFQPRWPFQPPKALVVAMLVLLALGFVGIGKALGLGGVANAAHVGGLLCGAALGAIFGLASRGGGDNPPPPQV